MTATQGWIVIGLLVLILGQLVIVGLEMSGLRRELTSGINKLFQKLFGNTDCSQWRSGRFIRQKRHRGWRPFLFVLSRSGSLAIGRNPPRGRTYRLNCE